MEEKNELPLEEETREETAKPDPRDENFINWKERMYDKIPAKKIPTVLRFLDFLIPAIFVAIVLIILFGRA